MATDQDKHPSKELSKQTKQQMEVFTAAVKDAAQAAADGDKSGFDAAFAQMSTLAANADFNSEGFLNALHVPENAGEYEDDIRDMLAHIPDGWGRWLSLGSGWFPLVVETHKQLLELFPDYEIHQVKEKYGTLRYYWASGDPYTKINPYPLFSGAAANKKEEARRAKIREQWSKTQDDWYETPEGKAFDAEMQRRSALAEKIVEEAEEKSATVCERCGDNGHLTERGSWLKTLCRAHAAEEEYSYVRDWLTVPAADNNLSSADDARQLISLIGKEDKRGSAQILRVDLYVRGDKKERYLGAKFVTTLLDWVAERRCQLAILWKADPLSTIDFTCIDQHSQEFLSAELEARGLEDRSKRFPK